MPVSSFLSGAIRRIVKEGVYTAAAVIIVLGVYQGALMLFSHPRDNRYIEQAVRATAGLDVMVPGKRLAARGVDLGKHPFSFFVITSPACVFCIKSAPFHRSMIADARNRAIPLFMVLPGAKEARGFLSASGFQNAAVANWADLNLRVAGTPTVVLVDSKGAIRRIWRGELNPAEQSEVLEALRDPSHVTSPPRKLDSGEAVLSPQDVRLLSSTRPVTIVSIEERDSFNRQHPAGAVGIPFEELGMRAPSELKRGRLCIVDCTTSIDAVCSLAVSRLKRLGFDSSAVDFSLPAIDNNGFAMGTDVVSR